MIEVGNTHWRIDKTEDMVRYIKEHDLNPIGILDRLARLDEKPEDLAYLVKTWAEYKLKEGTKDKKPAPKARLMFDPHNQVVMRDDEIAATRGAFSEDETWIRVPPYRNITEHDIRWWLRLARKYGVRFVSLDPRSAVAGLFKLIEHLKASAQYARADIAAAEEGELTAPGALEAAQRREEYYTSLAKAMREYIDVLDRESNREYSLDD